MRISSYKAVFQLERRIYRIDGLALNPAGVPLRGIAYFAALLAGALVASRLPLLAPVARIVPWYVRGLLGPAALAVLLTAVRVDGRPCHVVGRALIGYRLGPRRLVGLRRGGRLDSRLQPGALVVLPDGSDARPRRLRYVGPGAALARGELVEVPAGARLEVGR